MTEKSAYYVPHGSIWPIVGTVGLFTTAFGFAHWINGHSPWGREVFFLGLAILVVMLFGWFGRVIHESVSGFYNSQVDVSFRMGMIWFIFSEVMFFAAFFGALFYARTLAVPWLGGAGQGIWTNHFLWEGFTATWPSNGPGNIGGNFAVASPWGIPLLNTLLLLSSGVTVTIAHLALKSGRRGRLVFFMGLTVLLGWIFLGAQAYEYYEAYEHFNLTLGSGIYGSTFYLLTGFHGAHVTIGSIMLLVIMLRCAKGHFTGEDHFAFESVTWYWHFVDVVWIGLFLFVYVL